jgi:hypothetical protein
VVGAKVTRSCLSHTEIGWVNDIEFCTIKPVLFIDTTGDRLEFEVRRDNAATGTAELVAVGNSLDDAVRQAHALDPTKCEPRICGGPRLTHFPQVENAPSAERGANYPSAKERQYQW